jgi:hypothetical protein
VHDGIELDATGIPAAVICTDSFLPTGRAMARERGFDDYPIVVVQHPIITLTEDELHVQAEKAIPEIVRVLTGTPR